MKNDVVVRIKYAQRMGVRCVSVGMIGVMGIVTICLKEIWKLMLAGLPVVLFLALLLWYFESWQIVFSRMEFASGYSSGKEVTNIRRFPMQFGDIPFPTWSLSEWYLRMAKRSAFGCRMTMQRKR